MALARAYVAISHDPIVANGQKFGVFWSIHEEFERQLPNTKRASSSLPHRWSALHRCVSKFAGMFRKMENNAESDKRHEDYVADAFVAYQAVEGKAFRHRDVWEYLSRESPKFFNVPDVRTDQTTMNPDFIVV
ncbi:hypothetical protein AC1031_008065 [Aphanomyces cochlioides]|nr:hypothetical protein AC1031_008065 [Aphanomyces cochlioides]